VKTYTSMRKGMELNKNIARKSLHDFVQRLLVRSVRQYFTKPQVLMPSQQNCSNQGERQHWTACTEFVLQSGKQLSGQRNGRSPHSSHFPRKVILNSVNNNCFDFPCKQHSSSDRTGNHLSEDRNRHCRQAGRISTR